MSWKDLFAARATRRMMLRGSVLAAGGAALPMPLIAAGRSKGGGNLVGFEPLPASTADEFTVAKGFESRVLVRWGDDLGGCTFGSDPDFTAFMPIDLLDRGFDLRRPQAGYAPRNASSREGLLVVNHEYLDPRFLHGPTWRERSPQQLARELGEVGVSISRVSRRDGVWRLLKDRTINRKYDARTEFRLTGPAESIDGGPQAIGTLANCSGGVTPWGTVLSCEENFQNFQEKGLRWDPEVYGRRHYGWVVEIDPYDAGAIPRKHTALGRFRHENVGIRVGDDGTVVAYMGDDKQDSCVFKFVAERKLSGNRERDLSILESGHLYAADFANGRWLLLDSTPEALADARRTALDAGATPVDRPEDLEMHPRDGSVFIAMTNNALHGNFYGHIVRLVEKNDDPAAMDFEWGIFATGGPQSSFSCPDNLLFGDEGNLWMCTDVSDDSVARGIHAFMGNNSLFLLPRDYTGGHVYRFATGPVECELTGPSWTPDGSTMFLAVQHPGGESRDLETRGPASHWPDGGDEMPRGAVVAITGFSG